MRRNFSKYHAIRTNCGQHDHASKREATRCKELQLLERGGQISTLEQQPRYDFQLNGIKICRYVGDWRYRERIGKLWGEVIVEDSKGVKTQAYVIKRKLMKAFYDIDIRETK